MKKIFIISLVCGILFLSHNSFAGRPQPVKSLRIAAISYHLSFEDSNYLEGWSSLEGSVSLTEGEHWQGKYSLSVVNSETAYYLIPKSYYASSGLRNVSVNGYIKALGEKITIGLVSGEKETLINTLEISPNNKWEIFEITGNYENGPLKIVFSGMEKRRLFVDEIEIKFFL